MPTVLVVDDSEVDRRLAGGQIQKTLDVNVVYADNGEHALEQISRHRPDVVVTDLQMPEVDGLQLIPRRRGHCFERAAQNTNTPQGTSGIPSIQRAMTFLLELYHGILVRNLCTVEFANHRRRRGGLASPNRKPFPGQP